MSRYKNVYMVTSAFKIPKALPPISDRESDLYLEFNSSDRLDLISHRIYGTPEYWWLILAANNYVMEFDIPYGEILRVPFPLLDVLSEIRSNIGKK